MMTPPETPKTEGDPDRRDEPRPSLGGEGKPRQVKEVVEATLSLLSKMHELTPRTWVELAIVIANVVVYVAMIARGIDFMSPTPREILDFGGNSSGLTTDGEWWRLLTCM